jgi:hypothetical protein
MVFNLSAIESGSALNAERPHSARPDGRPRLQAADNLSDELLLPRLGHAVQAMGNGEGSIAQRAFRDHSRDLWFFARQSMALKIRGCGTQQCEHARVIVHGCCPEF